MKQRGFTLIEILIGMTISGIIFLSVNSLLSFVYTTTARVKEIDQLSYTKNDISLELSSAIRWAETVVIDPAAETISITTHDGISHTYTRSADRLAKNGEPFTPRDVVISSFGLKNYSQDPSRKSLEITISMHDKNAPIHSDSIKLVISQRVVFAQTY